MRVKELENDYEVFQYDDDYSEDEKMKAKNKNQGQAVKEEAIDASDVKLKLKKKGTRVPIDDGFSSDEEDPKDKELIVAAVGETVGVLGNIEGAVIGIDNIMGGECTAHMKQIE